MTTNACGGQCYLQLFRAGILAFSPVPSALLKRAFVTLIALMLGVQAQIAATMPLASFGDRCDELHESVPATPDHASADGASAQDEDNCGCACQSCHSPALASPLTIPDSVTVASTAATPATGQRHFSVQPERHPPRR